MKILHIITSLRTGGAERLVAELAIKFTTFGDEVSILVFDGTKTLLMDELKRAGVPVFTLREGADTMRNPFLLPRLSRFLRNHPFDIIHTHNTSCQFLVPLVHGHTPLVTTEHNVSNRRRSRPWFRSIDFWMYRQYDQIICVGEKTRDALRVWLDRPKLSERINVIPNGIDLDRYMSIIADSDKSKHGSFEILMVAAFRPQKDHPTLIRALQFLPKEYRLQFAGGAETEEDRQYLLNCKALVLELGLENRVRFLGIQPDIPSLMANCDVVVLSSFYEGFGLSALEGMAAGKVVIASDVPGLRELVSGAGILFPQGDANALAARIQEACENPEKAREIGQKCRERARKYDIAETARKYRELYESVLTDGNVS